MIYINDNIAQLPLETALLELSDQRREQALKFKHEQGRRLCVAAYLLLKEGLAQEYGINESPVFAYNEHGKPHIEGCPDIHFNLSHCREGVLCGLSSRPIGVDIESIREYKDSLATYTMNEDELRLINSSPRPDVAFIRLWTMKESFLKLSGEGIMDHMKDVLAKAEGQVGFTTVVNLPKNYIYSICEYHQAH